MIDKRKLIEKLAMVWCTMNSDKTLGQVLTQACAYEEWTNEIWMLTDEKLEAFVNREIARFTTQA